MSLVLSRRIGETVRINDDIDITVAGISQGQVKISIDAPKHISVHRKEVWLRIQAEKEAQKTNAA